MSTRPGSGAKRIGAITAILAFAASPSIAAQNNATGVAIRATTSDLVFQLATDQLPASQTQMIGGTSVNIKAGDWGSLLVTPLQDVAGGKVSAIKCTGTLVGPGVVLFAAHCLDMQDKSLRAAYLRIDTHTLLLTCAVQPQYQSSHFSSTAPRNSEDFALCYLKTDLALPALKTIQFERVDVTPVAAQTPVLIMGFGCTDIDMPYTQDQVLRAGGTRISQAASDAGLSGATAQIDASAKQPALCPGDSGGPMFTGATMQAQTLKRRVRGVNSEVTPIPTGLQSSVSMLSHPDFAAWAKGWIGHFSDAYICGLNEPVVSACRV